MAGKKGLIVPCLLTALIMLPVSAASGAWFQKFGIHSKQELANPSSVPKLVNALQDRDANIRKAAAAALGNLGPAAKEAIPALSEVLAKDRHPNVRGQAAKSLGAMKSEGLSAAPSLVTALSDRDAETRKQVMHALKRLGYKGEDLRAVLRLMAANDPHSRVKAEAAKMLAGLDQQGSPTLARDEKEPPEPARDIDLPKNTAMNRHGVAVIIGNRNYAAAGKDVPDVAFAHNDADAVYQYVTETLGFREGNVIMLKDASQADLVATFGVKDNPKGKLYDWVRPAQSDVFVYYSGHGAPGLGDGRSYLLPVDANSLKVELNGYPLETLYANLAMIPARSTTVVVDACFSGLTPAGTMVKNASSITLRPVAVKTDSSRMTIITASGLSQVASWDEKSQHGLFTSHFLQGVSNAADQKPYGNGDGKVTLAELKKYLEEEVPYEARRNYGRDQNPQVSGNPAAVLADLQGE